MIFLFLHLSPGVAEADDAVDDHVVFCRIGVDDEIALAQELKLIAGFIVSQCLFSLAVVDDEAVGIDLVEEILGVAAIVLAQERIVDPRFDIDGIFGVDPVEGAFYLRSALAPLPLFDSGS